MCLEFMNGAEDEFIIHRLMGETHLTTLTVTENAAITASLCKDYQSEEKYLEALLAAWRVLLGEGLNEKTWWLELRSAISILEQVVCNSSHLLLHHSISRVVFYSDGPPMPSRDWMNAISMQSCCLVTRVLSSLRVAISWGVAGSSWERTRWDSWLDPLSSTDHCCLEHQKAEDCALQSLRLTLSNKDATPTDHQRLHTNLAVIASAKASSRISN